MLNINQSIKNIETYIDQQGGDDKEVLLKLLCDAKLLIEDIKKTSQIQKKPEFAKRLANHMEKHSYLYGEIINLFGKAFIDQLI